jgi:hypothetical protein
MNPSEGVTGTQSESELAEAGDWLTHVRDLQARLRDRARCGAAIEWPERELSLALEKVSVATQLRIAIWNRDQRRLAGDHQRSKGSHHAG